MENNTRKLCNICNKSFANGKAMGGHMRSHLVKLPLPPKPKPTINSTPPQNPTSKNPPPSPASSSSQLHNHLPPRAVLRKRRSSRLRRNSVFKLNLGSSLITCQVICLSRGTTWVPARTEEEDRKKTVLTPGSRNLTETNYDGDGDDDDNYSLAQMEGGKYKCNKCNKIFSSYQALGGHRASHRKLKLSDGSESESEDSGRRSGGFECPVCGKTFNSGQALGGHKKVHMNQVEVGSGGIKPPAEEEDSDSYVSIATAMMAAEARNDL